MTKDRGQVGGASWIVVNASQKNQNIHELLEIWLLGSCLASIGPMRHVPESQLFPRPNYGLLSLYCS